jgi:putative oxidoreductase
MIATSIQARKDPRRIGTRRIGSWVLQGLIAAVFLAAGGAKLAGVPFMVQLFNLIGIGQWFRIVTGIVEITGAVLLLTPGLASIGGLWLGGTMVGAVATHLLIHQGSPLPAVILGALNALIVYLRRDELLALAARIRK